MSMRYPADLSESFEALSGFLSVAEDVDSTLARIASGTVALPRFRKTAVPATRRTGDRRALQAF